ncbi:phosphatase PAP2 family protein [Erythrobacter sp. JK5]|uniref:phosphatase PAP2 family protein n=1 Tax=Erythrobacter sp. JK5 TaxID=2829500 RepID=UPI001BA6A97C|nr:phosphatase PAP2 family protein [Erythrobacter sp. JK5]QUL39128.1 phosphatase PAP2 family protein [Erythrobacter sp. JK5]
MNDTAIVPPMQTLEQSAARRWLGEVPIYAIGLALMALCIGLLMSRGVNPSIEGIFVNARLFGMFVVVLVAWDAGRQLYRARPVSPVAHLKARYADPGLIRTIRAGLPLLAVAIVLLPYFSKMKAAIPLFNDYTWDQAFIEWDRAIFFGHDAWQVLQPVFGYPVVTAFLALLYQLWFLLLYPGVMFFAFARIDSDVRRQFFLSYVLSWTLIGGAMATWLASVGPCFVGPMLGNPAFDAQMAYLNSANQQIPIMVLPVQEMLLEWYGKAENGLGSGITAMPSMHCAIAFLYWLAMRRISPRLGVFFGVFFVITWIGSVHLAYHYAVDGLVSLIAVAAIWKASQAIIAAWDAAVAARQATLRTNTVPAE